MSIDRSDAKPRGILLPIVFVIVALAVLIGLGTWQVERKAWKEALIADLTARLAAKPAALPAPADWPKLRQTDSEFRQVTLKAELLTDAEALVYTTGSSLRADTHGPGYWVFTPARLSEGDVVVINRGFVPEGKQARNARGDAPPLGTFEIVGVMRWPEAPGLFQPRDDAAHNIFFGRDQIAMAAAKGWGVVAPFYVEQEAPAAPSGLPQVGRLQPNLPNNHLQYALTWYGLAVVLVGVFGFRVFERRH